MKNRVEQFRQLSQQNESYAATIAKERDYLSKRIQEMSKSPNKTQELEVEN